jgi:hypothetical protein
MHDEEDGGPIGASDMEAIALSRGSPRATRHGHSRSGCCLEGKASSNGETKMPVGCPGSDEVTTTKQCGLPPRCSREVGRLFRDNRLVGLDTDAPVNDRPYACVNCSMTFGRETTLCGHMRSHMRDHLSSGSESEEDTPPTPKRRRKKRKSKQLTPLVTTWGNTERRNGSPRHATTTTREEQPPSQQVAQIHQDLMATQLGVTDDAVVVVSHAENLEVKVSGSESNVVVPNIGVTMHGSKEVTENSGRSSHDNNPVIIIIDDDNDDDANPVITVAGSPGAPGLAPDAAAAVATAPALAVAMVATPTVPAAPHVAASMTIQGAPASDHRPVKGNNGGSGEGARYGYGGGNSLTAGYDTVVDNGKAIAGYSNNACYGGRRVSTYSGRGYGEGLDGSSIGSHNYSTFTTPGGESKEAAACGKVYGCPDPECKNSNTRRHSRIMEKKDKAKLVLHSGRTGTHKCKVAAADDPFKTIEATGINGIGGAVDDPYNLRGWRFPAGSRSTVLPRLATRPPAQQPPQGTVAMAAANNPVTGRHFSAGSNTFTGWSLPPTTSNTFTGWSLPPTTSSILPAVPLHNQEQNLLEQIAAAGHRSINPALFSFSRRQEENPLLEGIAVVPSNAIASSSSTPRPGVAAATHQPSEAIGINSYFPSIVDAPANTMGRRLPFFLAGTGAGRSDIHALPVCRPVRHPAQVMATGGDPLTGHFPAAISATGWSLPATTSSGLSAFPLQNPPEQIAAVVPSNTIGRSSSTRRPGVPATTEPSEAIAGIINSNVAAIDALTNTMRGLPFFLAGRSAIHAPPVSRTAHRPSQGMGAMVGNPVSGHFPPSMAANGWPFLATTSSSILPAIPPQNQEHHPPQGRLVVPANGEHPSTLLFGSNTFPTLPSQNQAENPPADETVPGNNGGRAILLFGINIAEGQKEVREPKK